MMESRQLLAADFHLFEHNRFDPEDVNADGLISPVDVLMVVNSMNRNATADREGFIDVNNDGLRSPLDALLVINRLNGDTSHLQRRAQPSQKTTPEQTSEIRSIDGTGNNLSDPSLGSAGTALLRVAAANYSDGISSPAEADLPSTREISNVLSVADEAGTRNERGLSAFIYVWGQFLDHDIDLSETQTAGEAFDIAIPTGDAWFDPSATGEVVMSLTRSEYDESTGTSLDNPRQQVNSVTAFVDGSMVYGSDAATASRLRAFEGGRLLMTDDGLLPADESLGVLAGDIRAAENLSLTALQTLFVREHNRKADEIAQKNTSLDDEAIYQQARAWVVAEIQAITYNEFLPALLGSQALSKYSGYDPTVNPTIANEFSTAAFRFGHSTLNDDIEFFDNDGRAVSDELSLKDAFFNAELLQETGIDTLLKYEASTQAQEVDLEVVDSLRNFLFGAPGSGGFDLVALNIQRGRDHGLSDYNTTREAYGLEKVESFAQITSDTDLQSKLESLYGDVDRIDLWVGLLAEDHVRDASVGELTQTIIADQFERLRDGDRFWYEKVFQGSDLRTLQQTTLADVIERNTDVRGLQDNVFFMTAEVSGQVTMTAATNDSGAGRNSARGRTTSRTTGVEGVTVELLNDAGEVIDTTITDRGGFYRFGSTSIHETGDYQIQLVDSQGVSLAGVAPLDFLINNGSTRLRGLNFMVSQV